MINEICFFAKYLTVTFSVGMLASVNILFPSAKYAFNYSVTLNVVASKAASAVIVRHSINDIEFFIGRIFGSPIS